MQGDRELSGKRSRQAAAGVGKDASRSRSRLVVVAASNRDSYHYRQAGRSTTGTEGQVM